MSDNEIQFLIAEECMLMSQQLSGHKLSGQMRDEVDLIARFAETYRRRFSSLIDRMNRAADPATELASLRLCVEAVDMMLSNQKQLAKALSEITQDFKVNVQRPVAA